MSARKRRELSPDELGLWRKVAASVRPLPKKALPPLAPLAPAPVPPSAVPAQPLVQFKPAEASRPGPQIGSLDQSTERRIRRGRMGVDGRLDLHGHTQAHAHIALMRFLSNQRARGARLVLIITGKGHEARDGQGERDRAGSQSHGVLRRLVPIWLNGPGMAEHVVSTGEALPRHGGSGALYVYLRKVRE
jgi:DNA-nicking Smr family endonuclease